MSAVRPCDPGATVMDRRYSFQFDAERRQAERLPYSRRTHLVYCAAYYANLLAQHARGVRRGLRQRHRRRRHIADVPRPALFRYAVDHGERHKHGGGVAGVGDEFLGVSTSASQKPRTRLGAGATVAARWTTGRNPPSENTRELLS